MQCSFSYQHVWIAFSHFRFSSCKENIGWYDGISVHFIRVTTHKYIISLFVHAITEDSSVISRLLTSLFYVPSTDSELVCTDFSRTETYSRQEGFTQGHKNTGNGSETESRRIDLLFS